MFSDDGELQRGISAVESEEEEDADDADSGAGSDDFDLLELGETGAEFCQVENQTCSVPFELYDLAGLEEILSVDVWNECLSEDERFNLTKYLPDMDQEMFIRTLMELFAGCNFHFGSPMKSLFDMLKGGLCEPRVALYRQGLNFFQKRKNYHLLKKYQNNMVSSLCHVRDAWLHCRGYNIEERLRIMNIMRSQKSLMHEKMEELDTDNSEQEASGEGLWSKRLKDGKVEKNVGRQSAYGLGSDSESTLRGRTRALKAEKYGNQNSKGLIKLAGSKSVTKESFGEFSSDPHGMDLVLGTYGPAHAIPRRSKAAGYNKVAALRLRGQMRDDMDADETLYERALQRDLSLFRGSMMHNAGEFKIGKKHEADRDTMGSNLSSKNDLQHCGRNKNMNQASEDKVLRAKPPNIRTYFEYGNKTKYPNNVKQFVAGDHVESMKERALQPTLEAKHIGADRVKPLCINNAQGDAFSADLSYDDWNFKSKNWKTRNESSDLNIIPSRDPSPQMNGRFLHSEIRKKQVNYEQNGGPDIGVLRSNRAFFKSDETESDSSEELDDVEDVRNPLMRSKLACPSGESSRSSFLKSDSDAKRAKFAMRDTFDDVDKLVQTPEVQNHSSRAKKKGKIHDNGSLHDSAIKFLEDSYFGSSGDYGGDDRKAFKLSKKGLFLGDPNEMSCMPSSKAYSLGKRKKGGGHINSVSKSNHLLEYAAAEEDEALVIADDKGRGKLGKKCLNLDTTVNDRRERSEDPVLGCNSRTRRKKADATNINVLDENCNVHFEFQQQFDDSPSLKKRGKRKLVAPDMETSEPPLVDMAMTDVEMEIKPQKKPFTLITPTVHTGFSFSIIHLLSAVRMAMITLSAEDSLEPRKEKQESADGVLPYEYMDVNRKNAGQVNVPSLTVQEIVNRVRSNPGDPCILETQEPLQDLIRGILKIFSSKTAPLGAKGWKALVVYEKSTKCWNWIGPVSPSSSDQETIEEVTSPDSWGLPHKLLVKLVDSFANWLKSGQDTLQQIGSLPAPPASLLQFNLDEKERFRDLRAQKSLTTINPSTEEVRVYFRKEEILRYSIPDRAFSYTAADGRKSIVAPLRRCGGKPTSKARDHFMLKHDRPPHVTILCLVRDAAARLPGSIGTRADVCTLIRDSQYIMENVTDVQVNQVVSGALDRLHYERDPCVQFDGERKLWVYLHREREEEDFEDDGTSSTKKWKRPKKDNAEPSDPGAVIATYHETGEQTGFDLCSDLNAEPSFPDDNDKGEEPVHDVVRQNVDQNMNISHGFEEGLMHHNHGTSWRSLSLTPMQDNKLLCRENSTNEDFDVDPFSREIPAELLKSSFSSSLQ